MVQHAVYRNARYEARLVALESSAAELASALDFLGRALRALGQYVQIQNETLPGELPPGGTRGERTH